MVKILAFLIVLSCSAVLFAQDSEDDEMPARYLTQRHLGGVKFKLSDKFTAGLWGALYLGTSYFPDRTLFKPFKYQGLDIVPGFEVSLGKIIGNLKLSLGGELYYNWRQLSWNDEPDQEQLRPRGNIIISMPLAGTIGFQVIQRFERIIDHRLYDRVLAYEMDTYTRYRTLFKLSGPAYTAFKIAPYAYYEGFTSRVEAHYYEAEFGVNLIPIKGLSVSLADQIQSMSERANYETHQISVYVFYTIDFSK